MKQILTLFFVLLLGTVAAQAEEVDLGTGYTCTEAGIATNGKTLTEKKARKALKRKLKKQRQKRKSAKSNGQKKRAKKITAKIKAFKLVLQNISPCISGLLFAPDGESINEIVQKMVGQYDSGHYDFSSDGLGDLSGPVGGLFTFESNVLKGTLTFDDFLGFIFGGNTLAFELDTSGETFPLTTTVSSSTLGPIDIFLDSDLNLSLVAESVPFSGVSRVEWIGVFNELTGFIGTLKVLDDADQVTVEGSLCVLR